MRGSSPRMTEMEAEPGRPPAVEPRKHRHRSPSMKPLAILIAAAALPAAPPAPAKGCLKGAAVGGVAGHYAGHHGVLGAIAGCAYGRHRANEQARARQGTGRTAAPAGEKL